jgi:hypothetical protein
MSRSRLVVFSLILLFALSSFATPHKRNQPDQTIDTPVGKFTFTKLTTFHMWSTLIIEGDLANETSKSWDNLTFAIDLTDKNGKVVSKKGPQPAVVSADPNASSQVHVLHSFAAGAHIKMKFEIADLKADGDTLALAFKYAYGEYPLTYKIALSKPTASDNLLFTDDNINLVFVPSKTSLDFVLQNKGDAPITVSFVSPAGLAQGVIHNGIKLADRTAPKAPSMVPPRAKVNDVIIPVENVELVETDWITHSLLPAGPLGRDSAGQEFSVFMPLDIGGTTKNYNFVFKIVSVE